MMGSRARCRTRAVSVRKPTAVMREGVHMAMACSGISDDDTGGISSSAGWFDGSRRDLVGVLADVGSTHVFMTQRIIGP